MEIYADTIAQGWEESMKRLLNADPVWIPTEGRGMMKELRNMIIHIKSPWEEPRLSQKYFSPREYVQGYCEKFFQDYTSTNSDSIHFRVFKSGQIKDVMRKLGKSWYSRRGVISLWNPHIDIVSEYPPCICLIQVIVRDHALHLTAVLRSNDAWFSALPDMIVLSNFQRDLASELNVDQGEYVHHAISYHIYDYDYPLAKQIFQK